MGIEIAEEEAAKPKEERDYVHEPEMIKKPKKRPPKVTNKKQTGPRRHRKDAHSTNA